MIAANSSGDGSAGGPAAAAPGAPLGPQVLDILYVGAVALFALYVGVVGAGVVAYRRYPPLAARSPRLLLLGAAGFVSHSHSHSHSERSGLL